MPVTHSGSAPSSVTSASEVLAVLGERRPGPRLALAGLLVVLFALGVVVLYQRATARPAVLAAAREVSYGEVLAPEDLKVVHVTGEGIATIPADRLRQVVGRTTRASLSPGMVLAPSQLIGGSVVGPGEAVVGAALRPGVFPAGLRPGDRVRVVGLAAIDDALAGDSLPQPLATATVLSVEATRDASGTTAVSLIVPSEDADAVSAAGALGRISVILLGSDPELAGTGSGDGGLRDVGSE